MARSWRRNSRMRHIRGDYPFTSSVSASASSSLACSIFSATKIAPGTTSIVATRLLSRTLCRDINREFFDPIFWKVINGLDYTPYSVVDLGSGSGERLIRILDRYSDDTGVGIDIVGPTNEMAVLEALERGFEDRLSFLKGDVR